MKESLLCCFQVDISGKKKVAIKDVINRGHWSLFSLSDGHIIIKRKDVPFGILAKKRTGSGKYGAIALGQSAPAGTMLNHSVEKDGALLLSFLIEPGQEKYIAIEPVGISPIEVNEKTWHLFSVLEGSMQLDVKL